jgi:hypothetical protein
MWYRWGELAQHNGPQTTAYAEPCTPRPLRSFRFSGALLLASLPAFRDTEEYSVNKKSQKALVCLALGASLAGTSTAYADVQFNGFGQIVVGSTLGNKLIGTDPQNPNTYVTFPVQTSYNADPSFQPESLFALQAYAPLSSRLSATAQILAKGSSNGDGSDFTPKFAWAYVTYQLSDSLTVKAGRQRIPFYKYSDYLQVGEAYPWIRPPASVYASPLENYDGISIAGSYELGNWYLQPQLVYGQYDGTLQFQNTSAHLALPMIAGAVLDTTYNEWLNLRGMFFYLKNNSSNDQEGQVVDGLSQLSTAMSSVPDFQQTLALLDQLAAAGVPPAPATSPAYSSIPTNLHNAAELLKLNDPTLFGEFGFEINRNNVFLAGEYSYERTPNSSFFRASDYYVSLGYHFGKLMPVLLFGHTDHRVSNDNAPGLIPGAIGLPANHDSLANSGVPQLQALAIAEEQAVAGLNGAPINSVPNGIPCPANGAAAANSLQCGLATLKGGATELGVAQRMLNNFYEFGLRYDVTSNTALKLDYTYFRSGLDGVANARLLSAGFVFTF